jgi:acetolactate synthase-1/2/3 large subunit
VTGGAIGGGIPLATGAAIAAPDRRVINLQADGSAMYAIQGLWTQAREKLDVTTVIFSNRKYQILLGELANVGANPGRTALDMMDLGSPDIDFVKLARRPGRRGRAGDDDGGIQRPLRGLAAPQGPVPDRGDHLKLSKTTEAQRTGRRVLPPCSLCLCGDTFFSSRAPPASTRTAAPSP